MRLVGGVPLGIDVELVGEELRDLGEGVLEFVAVQHGVVLAGEVVAGEHQRAARVLLLGEAEQVRSEGELGLHLFLAVPEIVVADDGDDRAARVARGDLEGAAVVVELAFGSPAHPVAPLPLGRGVPCGQAELLLGEGADEVRREDHAAGVAGPVPGIERGVVLRQVRITRVAEDALHEIQVADQVPRHEEPRLHPLLGDEARHLRTDDRAEVERHEAGGLFLL